MSIEKLVREKLAGARRVALLGVGSTLRADDGAGMAVVGRIAAAFPHNEYPNLMCCLGETAPENFSGKICAFRPDHLMVIDAAGLGKSPGEFADIDPRDVGGPTYCSHLLPLKVMVDYIEGQVGNTTSLIGIQYGDIGFDRDMTDEVKAAVDALCQALEAALRNLSLQ